MAARYTLGTGERLKREKDIEALFRTGKALSVFPLRILYLLVPRSDESFAVRAGFSAPKKKFKRATDRNRVKRLLRESWRLQREGLSGSVPPDKQLHVFVLFTDNTLPELSTVFASTGRAILQLCKILPPISQDA